MLIFTKWLWNYELKLYLVSTQVVKLIFGFNVHDIGGITMQN